MPAVASGKHVRSMTARICIAALTALCTISSDAQACSDVQAQTSGKRPNVIVIFADADNGWAKVYPTGIVGQLTQSCKKYPSIPTLPGGASIGSELPEFVLPNMVARPEGTGSRALP